MELLRLLNNHKDLTILTNSAVALGEIGQADFRILSTGGILNKNSLSLQGSIAIETTSSYHLDKYLVSCKGICKGDGTFDTDEREAELKRKFIRQSNRIILLVDHTKFDRIAFVKVADWSDVDVLITDIEPSESWKGIFRENNIEVVF